MPVSHQLEKALTSKSANAGRRYALAIVSLFIFGLAFAQEAPLVERIEVSVTNVDVTVTDDHGNPVRGLTRDAFEIFDDGSPQPITNFYAVDNTSARPENGAQFRRKVLVLIDTIYTTPFERNQALEHLQQFIDAHFETGDYDWSIAAADTTLRVLLPLTSDKGAIHAALKQIRENRTPPLGVGADSTASVAASPRDRYASGFHTRDQSVTLAAHIDACLEAFRAFAGVEGKKIILILNGRLLPDEAFTTHTLRASGRAAIKVMPDFGATRATTEMRDSFVQEANASNLSVYILSSGGVAASDGPTFWIAQETGGRALPGNRPDQSLKEFDVRSSNYYSLGYRSPNTNDGKYHRIEVRVPNRNYRLQYRNGYASYADNQQLGRSMQSPFGVGMLTGASVHPTTTFEVLRTNADGTFVNMNVLVPVEDLTFLPENERKVAHVEISISCFDDAGSNRWLSNNRFDASLQHGDPARVFVQKREMFLAKGKAYRVAIAVRDLTTDAVGVLQQVVTDAAGSSASR